MEPPSAPKIAQKAIAALLFGANGQKKKARREAMKHVAVCTTMGLDNFEDRADGSSRDVNARRPQDESNQGGAGNDRRKDSYTSGKAVASDKEFEGQWIDNAACSSSSGRDTCCDVPLAREPLGSSVLAPYQITYMSSMYRTSEGLDAGRTWMTL
ncbi:MAG: hypothetical protein LQ352_000481 [Teloschistes flavicans]|nr:MAG: hypothetical protein LQ352_000481 [Teloschistes flavicans]